MPTRKSVRTREKPSPLPVKPTNEFNSSSKKRLSSKKDSHPTKVWVLCWIELLQPKTCPERNLSVTQVKTPRAVAKLTEAMKPLLSMPVQTPVNSILLKAKIERQVRNSFPSIKFVPRSNQHFQSTAATWRGAKVQFGMGKTWIRGQKECKDGHRDSPETKTGKYVFFV